MLDRLERAADWFGSGCLALLLALMTAQVVMRYGFNHTPFFTEEVSRYLLVWSALAGTAIAVRQGTHIRIAFLADLLPWRLRRWWFALLDLVSLALFVTIALAGVDMVRFAYAQTSQGMQIRLAYPYVAVPLFFLLAAVFALSALVPRRPSE